MFETLWAVVKDWQGSWPQLVAALQILGRGEYVDGLELKWLEVDTGKGAGVHVYNLHGGVALWDLRNRQIRNGDWGPIYEFLNGRQGPIPCHEVEGDCVYWLGRDRIFARRGMWKRH